jgi:hypothetical protein
MDLALKVRSRGWTAWQQQAATTKLENEYWWFLWYELLFVFALHVLENEYLLFVFALHVLENEYLQDLNVCM